MADGSVCRGGSATLLQPGASLAQEVAGSAAAVFGNDMALLGGAFPKVRWMCRAGRIQDRLALGPWAE